jgi:hypothetical protein
MRSPERAAVRGLFAALDWIAVTEEIADQAGRLARRYRASHGSVDVIDYLGRYGAGVRCGSVDSKRSALSDVRWTRRTLLRSNFRRIAEFEAATCGFGVEKSARVGNSTQASWLTPHLLA